MSWLDVKAGDLTLTGMHEGIRNANFFILLLTRDALFSPFVVMELLWAIDLGKKCIFIHIEESTENDYPYTPDKVSSVYEDDEFLDRMIHQIGGIEKLRFDGLLQEELNKVSTGREANKVVLKDLLSTKVKNFIISEAAGDNLIPYRRRSYETTAMMNHLMDKIGLVTPERLLGIDSLKKRKFRVEQGIEIVFMVGPLGNGSDAENAYQELKEALLGRLKTALKMANSSCGAVDSSKEIASREFHANEEIDFKNLEESKALRVFFVFLTPGFFKTKQGENIAQLEASSGAAELPLIAVERNWFAQSKQVREEELGSSLTYESILMHCEIMPCRERKVREYEFQAMLAEIHNRIVKFQAVHKK